MLLSTDEYIKRIFGLVDVATASKEKYFESTFNYKYEKILV